MGAPFQQGGGGGHAMGGGSKRFREVFQYDFNWQMNTAKGGKNVKTGGKSSNVGINVPQIGLAAPSKPSGGKINLNTPVVGGGLISPKKTVIESSVPKSLKSPSPMRVQSKKSAEGLNSISSLDIGSSLSQKKKGKK